jgi:hypothetical protein
VAININFTSTYADFTTHKSYLDAYKAITFTNKQTLSVNSISYEVRMRQLVFKNNTYNKNYGSGLLGGVITIRGAHFFSLEDEILKSNSDVYDNLLLTLPHSMY